jgi:predicted amidophosphoribosyltransferase
MADSIVSAMWKKLAGQVLPAPCLGCGAAAQSPLRLCDGCTGLLSPILIACDCCGVPLAQAGRCMACAVRQPRFTRRAAWRYNDTGRALMAGLKQRALYPLAAPLAGAAAALHCGNGGALEEFSGAELATAVPGHFLRRLSRGYNPAALLAQPLARGLEIPFHAGLLRRRAPGRQTGKSGAARRRIGRAFAPGRGAAQVRGKSILLIDDVETTGATLRAAALELLRLGAREVRAFTFFRVVERNN